MNTNELTYNQIIAGDIIPNDWCSIDLKNYTETLYSYTYFLPLGIDPGYTTLRYLDANNEIINILIVAQKEDFTVTFLGQPNSLQQIDSLGNVTSVLAIGEPNLSGGSFITNRETTFNGEVLAADNDYTNDKEICFKLTVWSLQCKFSKRVLDYINRISYGIPSDCLLDELIIFRYGLEVLNRYNPKYFGTTLGTELNTINYNTIVKILSNLSKN